MPEEVYWKGISLRSKVFWPDWNTSKFGVGGWIWHPKCISDVIVSTRHFIVSTKKKNTPNADMQVSGTSLKINNDQPSETNSLAQRIVRRRTEEGNDRYRGVRLKTLSRFLGSALCMEYVNQSGGKPRPMRVQLCLAWLISNWSSIRRWLGGANNK